MLEVAVIGAGAAGLAASRHLLSQGLRPSIFEAAKRVGGAWSSPSSSSSSSSSSPSTTGSSTGTMSSCNNVNGRGKMWDGLTTNLSKHTCRFSDWPWPDSTATFPSATDMEDYLTSYAEQFVNSECFLYECQVTNIASIDDDKYRVEWMDLSSQTKHSKDFEGVVVATGFFSKPHLPEGLQVLLQEEDDRILHSAQYVSHEDFVDQTVAVVGSSFSALEIAVDVSQSAKRVVSILPQIPWVVPRYIPNNNKNNNSILPVDLAFYARAQDAPQIPETTRITPPMARAKHEYLQSIVGARQAQTPLGIPLDFDKPPMVAISDYYLDLVVQGDMDVIQGRLEGIEATGLQVNSPEGRWVLPEMDKVICCTGYESDLETYLDDRILKTMDYDATDTFCPMTTCWDTLHPSLPNLFFCGMHRGPYMGIMELQGRLAAGVLSGTIELDESKLAQALETSRDIRHQRPRAQFPHFDYVGFMDTLAEPVLKGTGFPKYNTQKGDIVSPAFYQMDDQLAQQEQEELKQEVEKGTDGSRVPSVVLSAIIGSWKFHRDIVHHHSSSEGRQEEHVHGTVHYSRPKLEYVLYREDGFYQLTPTKTLPVFREYDYLVNKHDGCLEIYFVETGKRAALFLSLKFTQQNDEGYWVATSDHLCIKDLYKATFQVKLDGLVATEIIMTYRVKGPAKDYESTTILTPQR
jgi:cation diffusion facilitator CzcD-associated flavoprotein CzcO